MNIVFLDFDGVWRGTNTALVFGGVVDTHHQIARSREHPLRHETRHNEHSSRRRFASRHGEVLV